MDPFADLRRDLNAVKSRSSSSRSQATSNQQPRSQTTSNRQPPAPPQHRSSDQSSIRQSSSRGQGRGGLPSTLNPRSQDTDECKDAFDADANSARIYKVIRSDSRVNLTPLRIEEFINDCCSSPDYSDLARSLTRSDNSGLNVLGRIVNYPFSLDAGRDGYSLSFQRAVLPLINLLITPRFISSPDTTLIDRIYQTVCTIDCIKQIIGMVARITERENTPDIEWYSCFSSVVSFLLQASSRTSVTSRSHLISYHDQLLSWIIVWKSRAAGRLYGERKLKRLDDMLARFKVALDSMSDNLLDQASTGPSAAKTSASSNSRGVASDYRHDNDHKSIQDIQIIPTASEVLSRVPASLPTVEDDTNLTLSDLIDRQFRWIRENTLASIRSGIPDLAQSDALVSGSSTFKSKPGGNRRTEETALFDLFRNAVIYNVQCKARQGVSLVVEFDQPAKNEKLKWKKRVQYWKDGAGSRQLQTRSLVGLWMNVRAYQRDNPQLETLPKLFFGVVVERINDDDYQDFGAGDRLRIAISLPNSADMLTLFSEPLVENDECVLLQQHGHFFLSSQVVLKTLQSHTIDSLPFEEQLISGHLTTKLPMYLDQKG